MKKYLPKLFILLFVLILVLLGFQIYSIYSLSRKENDTKSIFPTNVIDTNESTGPRYIESIDIIPNLGGEQLMEYVNETSLSNFESSSLEPLVHLYITEVNQSTGKITANVLNGPAVLSNVSSKVFNVECAPKFTSLYTAKNFEYVNNGFDFFKVAEAYPDFLTKCVDENCNTVGKMCVLLMQGDK